MEKRLYKSRKDKMLFGVCGGLAEYFSVDPTLVRLVMVLIWMSGAGFLAYIIAGIIMPEAPYEPEGNKATEKDVVVDAKAEEVKEEEVKVEEVKAEEVKEED